MAQERIAGVIADRQALVALTCAVLERVTGPRASAAAALVGRVKASGLQDLETRLARELFELAAARPVRLERDVEAALPRAVGVADVPEPDSPEPQVTGPAAWSMHLVRMLEPVLDTGPGRLVRANLQHRWKGWGPARRRVVLAAGAATISVVVALAVVPGADPGQVAALVPVETPTSEPLAAPEVESAVTGDDPVAALEALLARRTDCLRDLSVLCLDAVDEAGSAAFDDDRMAIDLIMSEGVQPAVLDAQDAIIVERLGDSVLISLGDRVGPDSRPASVLLMKGEAGWRVRDYLIAGNPAES